MNGLNQTRGLLWAGALFTGVCLVVQPLTAQDVPKAEAVADAGGGADAAQVGMVGAQLAVRLAKEAADQANRPGAQAVEGEPWGAKLMRFKRDRLTLAPQPAAEQWLALLDQGMREGDEWEALTQTVAALPAPQAWPLIFERVKARPIEKGRLGITRSHALRVLAGTLVNDQAFVQESVAALKGMLEGVRPDAREQYAQLISALESAVERREQGGQVVDEQGLRAAIADSIQRFQEWGEPDALRLPDMVKLFGADKAQALLAELIVKPILFDFSTSGEETVVLGRRVMMENMQKLSLPQWSLVGGENTISLYELLDKRFFAQAQGGEDLQDPALVPPPRRMRTSSWEMREMRSEAETAYLLALLKAGMKQKAQDLLVKRLAVEDELAEGLEFYSIGTQAADMGVTDELWALFEAVMDTQDKPSEMLWEAYIYLGEELDKSRQVAARLDAAVKAQGDALTQDPEMFQMIYGKLYQSQLGIDDVEQAVKTLRTAMADWPKPEDDSYRYYDSPGQTLAQLGLLLDQPAWVDEGIAWMALPRHGGAYDDDLIETYEKAGMYAEAEQLLHKLLVKGVRLQAAAGGVDQNRFDPFNRNSGAAGVLDQLTRFYHRLGRHEDVLHLLEGAPWWPVDDLAKMLGEYSFESELAVAAAAALAEAGRVAEARQIARTVIHVEPDHDPAYAVFVSVTGEAALAELDLMYQRDQFEERPLIWKAHLLNKLGRHDEAAKVAKQAITIDPSDGDQGKGDRMRVYAVLADALTGLGQDEDAAFYREVVASIRMSEHADDLFSIGLTKQAAALYQQALNRFADAYCIQSRLAIRLYTMGRHEEAAEHYRRAFELMPDSFGRVESHCFGCEGVFSGVAAQNIADEVFTQMLKQTPDKPQLHYLLGYLRSSQDRDAVAVRHFQKAVDLDPDYVNAWRQLSYSASSVQMPPKEMDDITFNLLRLDPMGRHGSVNTDRVYDLGRLWAAVDRSIKIKPVLPDKLLPLATAAEPDLEALDPELARQLILERQFIAMDVADDQVRDPADVIAEHEVFQALNYLVQGGW